MISGITLFNNLTFSLAVLFLLSTIIHSSKRRYITAFILITAAGLLLTDTPNRIMPVNIVALTLCFARSRKEIRRTLYAGMTVTFLLWGYVVAVSSTVMLIVPAWHGSVGYNLFMGGGLLGASLAAKLNSKAMNWYLQLEHKGYIAALELVILLFFSFVLPRYYPAVVAESVSQWAIFSLSFILVISIVALLINRMKNLEHQRRELLMQMEWQESNAAQIQAQFETVVTIRHFYTKLYQSQLPFIRDNNMGGLRLYFEKHIAPIHREMVQNASQLSNIKNKPIRNLLDVTAGQAAAMEHVMFDMDISGEILLPDSMELDVFEIMCNLIDNAVRELKVQYVGLLRIWLQKSYGHVFIQIANTLDGDLDINQIYQQNCDGSDGHGYGLKRVRAIVFKHPEMERLTYKDGMHEGKEILVQQIKITLEGG